MPLRVADLPSSISENGSESDVLCLGETNASLLAREVGLVDANERVRRTHKYPNLGCPLD